MSWYAKAEKREIRPGSSDPAIKPIGVILHVDAGNNGSLFSYFNGPSGGIESHFHIRKDGVVEQYRSTGNEADANYKANSFVGADGVRKGYISVETQGLEAGEWTAAQIASIKALLLWANKTHGIPLKRCATPTDPGVGYHTLFGAPSAWTPFSKSCPGPDRKRQFASVLVPWMAAVSAPQPPKKDDEMPSAEEIAKAVWNYDRIPYNKTGSQVNSSNPVDKDNPFWRPASTLEAVENRVRMLELKLDALIGQLTDDGK